jgi:hypothetical protein
MLGFCKSFMTDLKMILNVIPDDILVAVTKEHCQYYDKDVAIAENTKLEKNIEDIKVNVELTDISKENAIKKNNELIQKYQLCLNKTKDDYQKEFIKSEKFTQLLNQKLSEYQPVFVIDTEDF